VLIGQKKINTRWRKLDEEFANYQKAWLRHFDGEKGEWEKALQFGSLQIQASKSCIETLRSIDQEINSRIIPSFDDPLQIIASSIEKFMKAEENEMSLHAIILSEKRLILPTLRKEKLPEIADTLLQVQIGGASDIYMKNIANFVDILPPNTLIFRNRAIDALSPDSETVEIPIKEIILDEIFPELTEKSKFISEDIQKKIEGILRDISEIDQIVEFNLDSALDFLKEDEKAAVAGEVKKLAIEGLEHAKDQLHDLIRKIKSLNEFVQQSLLRNSVEFETQIQQLADSEKVIELKFRLAKAKAKEGIRLYQSKILKALKTALPSVLNFLGRLMKGIRYSYQRIRKITGLEPSTTELEDRLLFFMTRTKKNIEKLPYVYQRLFRIEPLSDERFFAGREDDIERLRREFAMWQAGQFGVTALVGEKGSGKTTLINFAKREIYMDMPLFTVELAGRSIFSEEALLEILISSLEVENCESIEALERMMLKQDEQKIIIVEDLQNLFLKTIDGFEAMEKLLLLISKTSHKIYWFISCTLYSWQYLAKVINISRFFQRHIILSGIRKDEIEKIILKRHRVSGFNLEFEVTDEIKTSKKYKKITTDEARQEYLKGRFFKQLQDLASGNISVTILFWVSAISKITKDKLVLFPDIDIDYTFLNRLPEEELFTLATLIQHEMLTPEEHALVFHQDVQKSLMLLFRMCNREVLVETPQGFKVHPLLYRPIVETLKAKNIIH